MLRRESLSATREAVGARNSRIQHRGARLACWKPAFRRLDAGASGGDSGAARKATRKRAECCGGLETSRNGSEKECRLEVAK